MYKKKVLNVFLYILVFFVLGLISVSAVGQLELSSTYHYASWACYDGSSEKQGDETSCRPFEVWEEKAAASCSKRCNPDKTKCGVDSFSIYSQCGENAACGDGVCKIGEDNINCPLDCPKTVTFFPGAVWQCQDGSNHSACSTCQESKSWIESAQSSCKGKCDSNQAQCGVAYYSSGNSNCTIQCTPVCGNGKCEAGEEFNDNCAKDCKEPVCTDSDNGKDYNVKGTTYGVTKCEDQAACNSNPQTDIDVCSSDNSLFEYYCGDDSYLYVQINQCPFGCKDGVCLEEQQPVCGNGICETGEDKNCPKDCCPAIMPPSPKEGCTYKPKYDNNQCIIGYDEECVAENTPPPNSVVLEADLDGKPISFVGTLNLLTPTKLHKNEIIRWPNTLFNQASGRYEFLIPSFYATLSCIGNMPCFDGIYKADGTVCINKANEGEPISERWAASGLGGGGGPAYCSQTMQPGGSLTFRVHFRTPAIRLDGVTMLGDSNPTTPPANSVILEATLDGKPISYLGGYDLVYAGGKVDKNKIVRFPTVITDGVTPGFYLFQMEGFYATLSCIGNMPCFDGIRDANGNVCEVEMNSNYPGKPDWMTGYGSARCNQMLQPGGHLVFTMAFKAPPLRLDGVTILDDSNTGGGGSGGGVGSGGGSGGNSGTPSTEMTDLLEKTNKIRATAGAKDLTWCGTLAKSGAAHIQDMIKNNYYGHQGADGSMPADRAIKAGYGSRLVGENLNQGPVSATVDQVLNSWMGSSGHANNLKDSRWQHVGMAHMNSQYASFWAQEFGTGGTC